MDLHLNNELADQYSSLSQISRVITEDWVRRNMFCPRCGSPYIEAFENNRPVADFFCPRCKNEFELKSKNGAFGKKVVDGSYDAMIERITHNNNPDFLFLSYSLDTWMVEKLVFIPKSFFTPTTIEKRKPLSSNARRAGWIGCNILLQQIPKQGQINLISDGRILAKDFVIQYVTKMEQLTVNDMGQRSWLMDVLWCIDKISSSVFELKEVYAFENELKIRHPQNNNIQAKLRQQLQYLRDKGYIEFLGGGKYRKLM
ncbi:MAG: DpnI domain-containing protein [Peptococcaceae bacterium]|nr:DpnI domain-containing protein [Peptococcaceae bacterium]